MTTLRQALLTLVLLSLFAPSPALADGYDRIAAKIAPVAKGLKRRRIGVLQFPYIDNRACAGPRVVQERLMTKLVDDRELQVVERASLGQMVDEITLGYKGLLDPRSSYQLGQILDADAVLTGTLIELPNSQIQINARLIRIPDGLILAAVESLVKRTWKDPSSLPDPPSIGHWLGDFFSPVASDFHKEADLNKFIKEQFDALNSAAPASVSRPAAAPDTALFAPFPNSIPAEGASNGLVKGRWVYEQNCTYCHGPQGKGSRAMAEIFGLSEKNLNLNQKSLERYSTKELINALTKGATRMPPYQKPLSEDDASNLLQYLRHLTASLDCAHARARVDALERDILELKARYWAVRLKKSKTPVYGAPKDMDSAIIDPALKKQFQARLRELSASDDIPELTPAEVERFVARDSAAFSLRQNCGL